MRGIGTGVRFVFGVETELALGDFGAGVGVGAVLAVGVGAAVAVGVAVGKWY